jgi:hypothetical protein
MAIVDAGPLQAIAPPTTVPTMTVTFSDGGTMPSSVITWIPLGSDPITLTANDAGAPNVTAVNFYNFLGPTGAVQNSLIGTATVDGGSASLTIVPGDLPFPGVLGSTNGINFALKACSVDSAGQVEAHPCSFGGNAFYIGTIGRVPNGNDGGTPPQMTALADGGSPMIWYFSQPTSTTVSSLVGVPANAVQLNGALGGLPTDGGTATYFPDTLTQTESAEAVAVVNSDGGSIDRYDSNSSLNNSPWLSGSATGLRRIVALTTKEALLLDNQGNYVYAQLNANPGSAVTAINATGAQPAGTNLPALSIGGGSVQTMANGAIVFWSQDSSGLAVRLLHPAINGGAPLVLGAHGTAGGSAAPQALFLGPSGEIFWAYTTPGNNQIIQAASFDGTNLHISAAQQIGALLTSQDVWLVPRPGVLLGTGNPNNTLRAAMEIDLRPSTPTITQLDIPTGSGPGTGAPLSNGVRDRTNQPNTFAISDDQSKAIFVTADPTGNTTYPSTYTLWLVDLATSNAQAIYGSIVLQTPGNNALSVSEGGASFDLAPHFVHSSAGLSLPVGATPSANNSIGAVVFAESLTATRGAGIIYGEARVLFARYDQPSLVLTAVDRTAISYGPTSVLGFPLDQRPSLENYYVGDSAAAQALIFLGLGDNGQPGIFSVSLAPAGGTVTASLLLDGGYGLQLREDTKRFLAVSREGTLMAGTLTTNPGSTLKPIAVGLLPGPGPETLSAQLLGFGFTPDGAHAWAFTFEGGDSFTSPAPPVGELQLFDLSAGTHTNFGQSPLVTQLSTNNQGLGPPPCFISQAQYAISQTTYGPDQPRFIGGAVTAAANPGLHTSLFVPTNRQIQCSTSLDGSEAIVIQTGNTLALAAPAPTGPISSSSPVAVSVTPRGSQLVNQLGVLPNASPLDQDPSVSTQEQQPFPNGGQQLPEWAVLQFQRSGFTTSVFKMVGEAAAFPSGPPAIDMVTDFNGAPSVARRIATDGRKALLFGFQLSDDPNGSYPIELPLAGKQVPQPLLP